MDILFVNDAGRKAYRMFTMSRKPRENGCSITAFDRLHRAMKFYLEGLNGKKNVVRSGDHDTAVLRNSSINLPPRAMYGIQEAFIQHFRSYTLRNTVFRDELAICSSNTQQEVLGNNNRQFTSSVTYSDTNCIYVALKRKTFKGYVCSWIGYNKDIYIGYYMEGSLSIVGMSLAHIDLQEFHISKIYIHVSQCIKIK